MANSRWRRVTASAIVAAGALTLTGCLQNPDQSGGAGGFGADTEPAEGDGVVTVLGAFGGQEMEAFEASLTAWEEESGIDVQYVSDQDFTTTILLRVNSGDAPDVGLFPQPGGVLQMAAQGQIVPIDQFLDYESLDSTLVNGFLDSARYQGRVYAAPMRMAVKSVVWYPKAAYEEGGWSTEPASLAELDEITEQIAADTGATPWCIGWESAQATGWVGTDWIEEYMLRLHGPDVYDDWIYHRIPFNDERVVQAFEAYAELATDDNVLGGSTGILNTPFAEAMTPAFQDDPDCYLMRQGNFATGFFPAEVQENLDEEVGIFVFPPAEDGYDGQPILGGGDLAAAFRYDTDTVEFMKFLTSDQFGAEWAQAGGWLSPHSTFDESNYPDDIHRQMAQMAIEADVFRYDGSDVMPKEVGSDSFWRAMVDFQNGADAQAVTDAIEAGWPDEGDAAAETGSGR
ncbi:ABC transporter substrate-binding protein [Ornithinimicrobium cerasi]|uniref:Alpha-glucoside transport system substrate-binding protein n=1 Tax=Ornithinimicrobium cerasi TaxID=2248773 RepID=A0A285VU15_9MICO|nr:ABC transporter substrate-binding protein [Ornithinimicrobium cerasi]SOC57497.1 alpha-glucoside transport system substrate-binding protein [Ornithinimicrobium cerasi]SOC57549.1 alpha-glucoside transport system substrate-binding protein [Ornithinimicrobium cerasi]